MSEDTGRCEPPESLRGVDGWHWVQCVSKTPPDLLKWHAMRARWEDDGGNEVFLLQGRWRYIAPVSTPAEIEALRRERDDWKRLCTIAEPEVASLRAEVGEWCQKTQLFEDMAERRGVQNSALRSRVLKLEGALRCIVNNEWAGAQVPREIAAAALSTPQED